MVRRCRKRDGKACAKIKEDFILVAGQPGWNENRKSWIQRLATATGISARQAKALFYGEIDDLQCKSAKLLAEAAERLRG